MSDLVDKENTQAHVYSDSEIQTKLATDLPHWFYEEGWIRRKIQNKRMESHVDGGQYRWTLG